MKAEKEKRKTVNSEFPHREHKGTNQELEELLWRLLGLNDTVSHMLSLNAWPPFGGPVWRGGVALME